jgi:hypothetical protein
MRAFSKLTTLAMMAYSALSVTLVDPQSLVIISAPVVEDTGSGLVITATSININGNLSL